MSTPAVADQIWNWCRLITKIPFLGVIILALIMQGNEGILPVLPLSDVFGPASLGRILLPDYYNTLEPIEPPLAERLPNLIAEHPNLARIFLASGLLIEFFFFLGSLGCRW
jgi:hypothetical protein